MTGERHHSPLWVAVGALVLMLAALAVLAWLYAIPARTCDELRHEVWTGDLNVNRLPDRCWPEGVADPAD